MARASWKAGREDRFILLCLECSGETGTRSASQASEGRSFAGSNRGAHDPASQASAVVWASTFLLCCQTLATALLSPHALLFSPRSVLSAELRLWSRPVHPSIFPDNPLSHQAPVPPLLEHSLRVAAPAIQTVPASLRLSLACSSQPGQAHSPAEPQWSPLPNLPKQSLAAPAYTGSHCCRSTYRRHRS